METIIPVHGPLAGQQMAGEGYPGRGAYYVLHPDRTSGWWSLICPRSRSVLRRNFALNVLHQIVERASGGRVYVRRLIEALCEYSGVLAQARRLSERWRWLEVRTAQKPSLVLLNTKHERHLSCTTSPQYHTTPPH